jgi:DNA-binding MarR family transcriptional regulator
MTSTTRWLDEREMVAWRNFIETHYDLLSALERDLSVTGMALGDYQVLVYLSESDDQQMRMCDLADRLQLSPSGLTRRLDGLVKAGHVRREPSTSDRRVMMATLTDEGMDALREAAPFHVDSVRRRVFDHLDDEQVENMATIFGAIHAGLEQ